MEIMNYDMIQTCRTNFFSSAKLLSTSYTATMLDYCNRAQNQYNVAQVPDHTEKKT